MDLDLIEKILDASEEKGQVCVKFRGTDSSEACVQPYAAAEPCCFTAMHPVSIHDLLAAVPHLACLGSQDFAEAYAFCVVPDSIAIPEDLYNPTSRTCD